MNYHRVDCPIAVKGHITCHCAQQPTGLATMSVGQRYHVADAQYAEAASSIRDELNYDVLPKSARRAVDRVLNAGYVHLTGELLNHDLDDDRVNFRQSQAPRGS